MPLDAVKTVLQAGGEVAWVWGVSGFWLWGLGVGVLVRDDS